MGPPTNEPGEEAADAQPKRMEVEIKAPVDSLEPIRRRLEDKGARWIDEREERDVYFAHPLRDFAQTDEALRIRRSEDGTRLTYKGPRVDEDTKTREEIDVTVEEAADLGALLMSLGFEPAGRVIKRREIFELDEATIALDRVEGLGSFVEIETVARGPAVEGARSSILALADDLGLDKRERRSYLELLLEKEEEAGAG